METHKKRSVPYFQNVASRYIPLLQQIEINVRVIRQHSSMFVEALILSYTYDIIKNWDKRENMNYITKCDGLKQEKLQ